MRVLIACLLVVIGSRTTCGESFVYVSLAGENRIAIYNLNDQTAELTPCGTAKVDGGPGSLTTDPSRKFLFASIRSVGKLASFRIHAQDGSLTLLSEVPAGADPAYVATDKTGRFLLSAYYRAGKVSVHRIDKSGALSAEPLQTIPTAEKAHSIRTDRSNHFAFVPHTGPNAIFQFLFDQQTGRLSANAVAKVQRPENTGPRHIAFHPTKDLVYVSDEQGSSVTVYRLDAKQGRLSAVQTISSLPKSFSGNNSTAHIEVDPSGRFVYIANRGHDSIAAFRINHDSGKLASLGQTPTEQTPRSFNIDPSGKLLIAAGQASGKLATFRINQDSGKLTRVGTLDVGKQPWWVLIVRLRD